MNVTIDTPFSIPIAKFKIEKNNLREFNLKLIKELINDIKHNEQKGHTGKGVKQSKVDLEKRQETYGELKEILEAVALPFLKYIGVRENIVDYLEVNNFWGNVTSKPAFHISHTHGYGRHIWTGVYYPCEVVDLTDESSIKFLTAKEANMDLGNLIFQDPSFEVKTCLMNGVWGFQEDPAHFSKVLYSVKPEEGLVVLFPTWLSHNVEPTFEASLDKSRISLAFMVGDVL